MEDRIKVLRIILPWKTLGGGVLGGKKSIVHNGLSWGIPYRRFFSGNPSALGMRNIP